MSDKVVVKLVSGDMFMAALIGESSGEYIFQDLIAIKIVQVKTETEVIEKTITHPFCALSLERDYAFSKKMVLFCKTLSPKIEDYYVRLSAAFHEERSQDDSVFDDDQEEQDDDQVFLIIPETKSIH